MQSAENLYPTFEKTHGNATHWFQPLQQSVKPIDDIKNHVLRNSNWYLPKLTVMILFAVIVESEFYSLLTFLS